MNDNAKRQLLQHPTIGYEVWYWPHGVDPGTKGAQPWPATICYVHTDHMINIAGFDNSGQPFRATSIWLSNYDGEVPPAGGNWCQWPFMAEEMGEGVGGGEEAPQTTIPATVEPPVEPETEPDPTEAGPVAAPESAEGGKAA